MAAVQSTETGTAPEMVHVAILRIVRTGREREFERLVQEFFQEAAAQPGVCGAYLIRPFAGVPSREYGILRSFASAEDRDRFYASELYRKWNDAVAPLVEGEARRQELHGMEAFFRAAGPAGPPRWKMAVLTWLGVNVAVYVFANGLPAVVELPPLVNLLAVNALVVASLTWAIMPLLSKLFQDWISPAQP